MDTTQPSRHSQITSASSATNRQRAQRFFAALIGALAVVGLVSGCTAASTTPPEGVSHPNEQYVDDHGGAQAEQDPAPGAEAGEQAAATAERAIRVNTEVRMRVDDLAAASSALDERVNAASGHFDNRAEEHGSHYATATFTIRVPADAHDGFVHKLADLGEVTSTQTDAEDVTLTKVDLESRIASLESSIKSLRGMMEEAKSTSEMLEIERELSDREEELASLKSQLEVLNDEITYSTVTITMSTDASAVEAPEVGFMAGLSEGWNNLLETLSKTVQGLGYALPGILIAVVLGLVIWFAGLRRLVRRICNSATSNPNQQPATAVPTPPGGANDHRYASVPQAAQQQQSMPPLPSPTGGDTEGSSQ